LKTVLADDRGRVTLGTSLVGRYGRRFALIDAALEIVLVPVAKNPVARLAQIGRQFGLDRYTLKQLREIARVEAEKEILRKNVCRH
jgi:hypothetical protein